MPFSPLPTNFIDHLSQLNPERDSVLELGSGEGALGRLIAPHAGRCLGLERRHPATGVVCHVVGDARFPPVVPGSVAVVVAGNLVRHLSPRGQLAEWVGLWRGMLRPGGRLFVFEDDPDPVVPAQRNFRDLQKFLARLLPESRGGLLPLGRFRELVGADSPDSGWAFGHQQNNTVVDPSVVLGFLKGGAGQINGAEAALGRAIGRYGAAPGRYWWATVGPEVGEPAV